MANKVYSNSIGNKYHGVKPDNRKKQNTKVKKKNK
tara:strand:- start:370 stop:474 length:105 start_codon:yes stop_codon:yes gene_type:complete